MRRADKIALVFGGIILTGLLAILIHQTPKILSKATFGQALQLQRAAQYCKSNNGSYALSFSDLSKTFTLEDWNHEQPRNVYRRRPMRVYAGGPGNPAGDASYVLIYRDGSKKPDGFALIVYYGHRMHPELMAGEQPGTWAILKRSGLPLQNFGYVCSELNGIQPDDPGLRLEVVAR